MVSGVKNLKLLHTIQEVRDQVRQAKADGRSIGFVPTMGALHEGHITLVRRAKQECDFVIVSVFVNPTQFGPTEDFSKYPRTLDADAQMCREACVDIVFAPSAAEMYPENFDSWIEVNGPTDTLEGERRPGHFRGVTTVCAKLFNITTPDRAYFGLKDYQQLMVIRKMVHDLNMPLEIRPVEIVREHDGLAMSSRNVYLSATERKAALVLHKSLDQAKSLSGDGEHSATKIRKAVEDMIKSECMAQIDYVAVVDAETLRPIDEIVNSAVVLLAVRFGATRLIDNVILGTQDGSL